MTVTIELIEDASAGEVAGAGPAHPILGGLLDVGTWARIEIPAGLQAASWMAALSEAAVRQGGRLALRRRRWRGAHAGRVRERLERLAEAGPVMVVVAGGADVLVVIAGPGLPALGDAGPAPAGRVETTVRQLAGLRAGRDSLLEERVTAYVPDHPVDTRLRQLYGD